MKVILISDVKKQGKKGEIIDVKDGYGKFLINNHQAVLLTDTSHNRLSKEKEEEKKHEEDLIKEANKVKEKLSTKKITFKVKTGAGDKVIIFKHGEIIQTVSAENADIVFRKELLSLWK